MKTIAIPMKMNKYNDGLDTEHVLRVTNWTFSRFHIGAVPAGQSDRQAANGPLVDGPWAYAYGAAVVLNNQGGSGAESERKLAEGTEHLVALGDHVIIDGIEYKIEEDFNRNIKLTKI